MCKQGMSLGDWGHYESMYINAFFFSIVHSIICTYVTVKRVKMTLVVPNSLEINDS